MDNNDKALLPDSEYAAYDFDEFTDMLIELGNPNPKDLDFSSVQYFIKSYNEIYKLQIFKVGRFIDYNEHDIHILNNLKQERSEDIQDAQNTIDEAKSIIDNPEQTQALRESIQKNKAIEQKLIAELEQLLAN